MTRTSSQAGLLRISVPRCGPGLQKVEMGDGKAVKGNAPGAGLNTSQVSYTRCTPEHPGRDTGPSSKGLGFQGWASLVAQLVKNPPVMQETLIPFLGWEDPWRRDRLPTPVFLGSLVTQLVKNPPAMQESWVGSLRSSREDPLKKRKVTHSSTLS